MSEDTNILPLAPPFCAFFYLILRLQFSQSSIIVILHLNNHTIMKISSILIATGIALLTASCGGRSQGSQQTDSLAASSPDSLAAISQRTDTAFCGTYRGTLPAADCPGIKAVITISSKGTYHMSFDYIERSDSHFEESGVYHVLGDTLLQLVTPSSGAKTYYKLKGNNAIIVADSLGVEPTGELAKMYVLTK